MFKGMSFSSVMGLDTVLEGTPVSYQEFKDKILAQAPAEMCEEEVNGIFEARHDCRQNPENLVEACRLNNLSFLIMHWASPSRTPAAVQFNTPVFMQGTWGTPLMWAAKEGHIDIVRFLLDYGADPSITTEGEESTALHWAILGGHVGVVRCLLNHEKTDPNQKNVHLADAAGTAIAHRNLLLFWMITEDAFLSETDEEPSNFPSVFPVSHSTSFPRKHSFSFSQDDTRHPEERFEMVGESPSKEIHDDSQWRRPANATAKTRIFHRMDPQQTTVAGHTYLHYAAWGNMLSACQYLIERWKFDPNAVDAQGRTPLVWASREGHTEVVEYLLSVGADASHRDLEERTALYYAQSRNHPETARALASLRASSTLLLGSTGENTATFQKRAGPYGSGLSSVFLPTYRPCRETRALGTVSSLFRSSASPMFRYMAFAGVLIFFGMLLVTRLVPPAFSYLVFGLYAFRNYFFLLWHGLPIHLDGSQTPSLESTFGASLASLFKGTWITRYRNPGNCVLFSCVLLFQCYAWTKMGLPPLLWFSSPPPPSGDLAGGGGSLFQERNTALWKFCSGEESRRSDCFEPNAVSDASCMSSSTPTLLPIRSLFGGCILQYFFFSSAEQMVSFLLSAIVIAIFCLLFLVKYHRRGDFIVEAGSEKSERPHWSASPLWRILKMGCLDFAHPRAVDADRQLAIPLRAFHCPEQDVYVRRYDSYSILLDCPISKCNKRSFVWFVTLVALMQGCMLVWGVTMARAIMPCQCPHAIQEGVPWRFSIITQGIRVAWRGESAATDSVWLSSFSSSSSSPLPSISSSSSSTFPSEEGINATFLSLANTTSDVLPSWTSTKSPEAFSSLSIAPLFSTPFFYMVLLWNLFMQGLPCRQTSYLLSQALSSSSFLWRFVVWYIIPSSSSFYGVWVFHMSVCLCTLFTFLMVRQWYSVWRGASWMELNNPIAIREDGKPISIFIPPKVLRTPSALVYDRYDTEEEEYYRKRVNPLVARTFPPSSNATRCIYASTSSRFANILLFLLGQDGRKWDRSYHVSMTHTPIYSPCFNTEVPPKWEKVFYRGSSKVEPPVDRQENDERKRLEMDLKKSHDEVGKVADKHLV